MTSFLRKLKSLQTRQARRAGTSGPLSPRLPGGEGWGEGGVLDRSLLPSADSGDPLTLVLSPADGGEGTSMPPLWPSVQLRRFRHALLSTLFSTTLLLGACSEPAPDLATARVEKKPFVHQVRAEGMLQAAERTVVAVPQEVERSVRLAWLAEEGTLVEEGELVARFDRLAFEQLREDSGDDVAAAVSKLDKVDLDAGRDLGELQKDYDVADLELIHAQRFLKTDNEVFSRRDILEDAIDEELARDRKVHAEGATDVRQEVADKEKRVLVIERTRAEREVDRAEKGLDALEVRAPHAGILTIKRNWQGEPMRVGTELWRGQDIAEIPRLDEMEAEVWVLEADAGGLEPGLEAEVIVEAHPGRVHRATIERMDALAKPKRRGSPVQYFGVTLVFDATDPEVMKPGQRVRATLRLAEREEALVVPRQAIVRQDGEPAVWALDGGAYVLTKVELGPVSPGLAVIESGLEDGQTVALEEPPPSLRAREERESEASQPTSDESTEAATGPTQEPTTDDGPDTTEQAPADETSSEEEETDASE